MGLFGDIFQQVGNIINLTNVFGGSKSDLQYPTTIGGENGSTVDISQITNRPKYDNKDWKSSRGYSFEVVRVDPNGNAQPAAGWKEFRLQINPQELSQDEIFAIEVTPTLRGVLVEHHGTVLKDIQIGGTTGISPLRREGGANKKSGNPILQTGHSGYQEFHELRSYFRAYVESKRFDSRQGGELRMIFKNYKDSEFLYVEPQKFSMKRAANRPFLYDYTIALKGIGVAVPPQAQKNGGIGAFLEKVDDVLETVQDNIDLAVQVINGSIGIVTRTERNVSDTLLNPLRRVNQAVIAIRGGIAQTFGPFGITRRFIDSLKSEVERLEANLADVFGIDLTGYNAATGRKSTVKAPVGRQPTYSELQVLNSLGKAKQALVLLAGNRDLFEQNIFDANTGAVNRFNGKINLIEPNSVRPLQILANDNIQSIAARELGNADRYRDIVILNNLKPPYIDPAGGPGVLKPGQQILLPQDQTSPDTGVRQNKIYNITRNMAETERAFGVDMRLTPDGDLAISNIGDADLIAGVDNMAQAIVTKILLDIGGLKRHPGIGTAIRIGEKVTQSVLNELQSQITASLTADPRIDSIPFLELIQEGGTTTINMIVKIRNISQPVPLPITLNVG